MMRSLRGIALRTVIIEARLCSTNMSRGRVTDSWMEQLGCACADDACSKISQEIHIVVQQPTE